MSRLPSSPCLALAWALCVPAVAAVPMSDDELARVVGAGAPVARARASGDAPSLPAAGAVLAALAGPGSVCVLTPAQFAEALAARGLSSAMLAGYDGQPVTQLALDSPPRTFSIGLADLLAGAAGSSWQGPGMGTLTLQAFDTRGTVVWSWVHP